MESDPDLNLETDRLEQLLEDPPPPQSVVVVEYRNRGVPIWIFFTLIVLVPLGALVVYDRTVTARGRVEAAQTRQSLEELAAKATTPTNNSAAKPTPGGVLFMVESGNSQTDPAPTAPRPATSATVAPAASTAASLNAGQGPGLATAGSASATPATASACARIAAFGSFDGPTGDSATHHAIDSTQSIRRRDKTARASGSRRRPRIPARGNRRTSRGRRGPVGAGASAASPRTSPQ